MCKPLKPSEASALTLHAGGACRRARRCTTRMWRRAARSERPVLRRRWPRPTPGTRPRRARGPIARATERACRPT
eukprot:2182950-Rhodomonas_salina.1